MKVKTFNKVRRWMIMLVWLVMGVALVTEQVLVALVGVVSGLVALSFLKTQVKGKLEDERVESVSGRAARVSFRVLMPILGLSSLALFVTGGETEFYYVRALGMVMGYVTSLGLVIYVGAYYYLNKKFGG